MTNLSGKHNNTAADTTATASAIITSLSSTSSSAEIAQQIKLLLREGQRKRDERADASRLDELRRLFAYLVQRGDLEWVWHVHNNAKSSNRNSTVASRASQNVITKQWNDHLMQQHKKMVQQLCRRIQQYKSSTAMRTLWGVLASSPKTMVVVDQNRRIPLLNSDLVYAWIRAVASDSKQGQPTPTQASLRGVQPPTTSQTALMTMQMEFLQPHRDVQYQALHAITGLATEQRQMIVVGAKKTKTKQSSKQHDDGDNDEEEKLNSGSILPERLVQILMMIPTPKKQEEMDEAQYLFAPPSGTTVANPDEDEQGDQSEQDDNPEDDNDDNSKASSEASEDSEDEDDDKVPKARRPAKRVKQDSSASFSNWNVAQAKYHRRALSRAWLAVLQLPLPTSALKQVLMHLPSHVLPLVPQPLRFSDFLLQAYDSHQHDSGIISILALEGLFLLMTRHGLEYVNFYQQLYRLITPQLFQVKFRTRFLQLLDKCLTRNDKLPSQMMASFIKRLCGIALLIPPASILFVLALCSNLLQQHKECLGLVHRSIPKDDQKKRQRDERDSKDDQRYDAFDTTMDDPSHTNALQSSLWELHALERHYHPAVATMAQSIGRPDSSKAPLHDLNEFVKLTYQALLDQEHQHAAAQRKKQKTVPVTFVPPTSLLRVNDERSSDQQPAAAHAAGSDMFASILS